MRKFLILVAVVLVLALAVAPAFAQERPNIPTLLAEDPDGRFTTLLAAVEAAGLGEALSGEGPFTVFAPTNDAFASSLEFLGVTLDDVVANPSLLSLILQYHVVPDQLFFRELTSGPTLTTLEGGSVQLDLTDGVFTINNVGISDVDNVASNGIVHVIDGVLVPAAAGLNANVRVAHFSPDAPAVDVYVNGGLAIENLAFPTISDWATLPVGIYDFAVVPTGGALEDAVLTVDDLALAPNTFATAIARGSVAGETLTAQLFVEDYADITDAAAQVVVGHFIEGAPAVDVTVNGGTAITNLAFPGTDGDNDGIFTLNGVAPGSYDLAAVAGGAALLESADTAIEGGVSYFIAAVGTLDAPQLAVAATNVAELAGGQ